MERVKYTQWFPETLFPFYSPSLSLSLPLSLSLCLSLFLSLSPSLVRFPHSDELSHTPASPATHNTLISSHTHTHTHTTHSYHLSHTHTHTHTITRSFTLC